MITTNIPYDRKVGSNLCNNFFELINKANKKYLDILFKRNEREALGRRLLIIIYLLEEYSVVNIVEKLKCGSATVTSLSKDLRKYKGDKENLLRFLSEVYYAQFPKKEKIFTYGGSRTVSGTKHIFGLDKKEEKEVNKKCPVPM